MRVLRILTALDPANGGPVSVFSAAVVSTAAAGAEVECLTLNPGAADLARFPDYERVTGRGVPVHAFPSVASASWFLWLARKRFDVVHVDGSWVAVNVAAVSIARIAGAKVFVTPHETFTVRDMARSKSRLRSIMKRVLVRFYRIAADCVVYSSRLEREDSVVRENAVIIPHPVFDDLAGAVPEKTRSGLVAPGKLVLGYLGRFHPKKRLEDIIAATAATPGAILHVAGGGAGPYADTVKALIESHSERVAWSGFLQRDLREAFFGKIDFLVLASDYECFGMAAAEAMVRGIPVVVSEQVGVATEVGNGAGFVVAAGVPSLRRIFAACLALTDDEYRGLQVGAMRSAASYSYSAHGRAQMAAYADVLERSSPRTVRRRGPARSPA